MSRSIAAWRGGVDDDEIRGVAGPGCHFRIERQAAQLLDRVAGDRLDRGLRQRQPQALRQHDEIGVCFRQPDKPGLQQLAFMEADRPAERGQPDEAAEDRIGGGLCRLDGLEGVADQRRSGPASRHRGRPHRSGRRPASQEAPDAGRASERERGHALSPLGDRERAGTAGPRSGQPAAGRVSRRTARTRAEIYYRCGSGAVMR